VTKAQSADALALNVKVDATLVDTSMKLRARMLGLLEYTFQKDARMMTEVADIRRGTGFLDLASDLTRLAHHYHVHHARLSKDTVLFEADDEQLALRSANGILSTFKASDPNSAITDLRNRAFTRLDDLYAALRSAMEFVFRNNPRELASFPVLRTAVLALTARSSRGTDGEDVVPAPVAPIPPVAPADPAAPTPGPFSRDPSPGGPGGKPFV